MNWITSIEMRRRDEAVVENLKSGYSNEKGFGMFRRTAEEKCPGLTTTYHLAVTGYPDLVVSGTTDTLAAQHRWILNFLCSYMMEEIAVDPNSSYVESLNRYLAHMGMALNYKVVQIDTNQFFSGYGFSTKRYYESGGVDLKDVTILQVIEMDPSTGCFPAISTMSQILFATVPFGQKEPTHANLPPVQNFPSNSGKNGSGH